MRLYLVDESIMSILKDRCREINEGKLSLERERESSAKIFEHSLCRTIGINDRQYLKVKVERCHPGWRGSVEPWCLGSEYACAYECAKGVGVVWHHGGAKDRLTTVFTMIYTL